MSIDNIEELPILNKEAAIKGLGSKELFQNMLDNFEDLTLKTTLLSLKVAMDELDYLAIRSQAHSLRGSLSYIYAERATKYAEKIQLGVENQIIDDVLENYRELIKQCIILKRTIRYELLRSKSMLL